MLKNAPLIALQNFERELQLFEQHVRSVIHESLHHWWLHSVYLSDTLPLSVIVREIEFYEL